MLRWLGRQYTPRFCHGGRRALDVLVKWKTARGYAGKLPILALPSVAGAQGDEIQAGDHTCVL